MAHEMNKELLDSLTECAIECNHCATACLDEQDVKTLSRCIKLDYDCATVCNTAIALVARGSEQGDSFLKNCAEICRACAEECEKHASKIEHCRTCAEACRRCAQACDGGMRRTAGRA